MTNYSSSETYSHIHLDEVFRCINDAVSRAQDSIKSAQHSFKDARCNSQSPFAFEQGQNDCYLRGFGCASLPFQHCPGNDSFNGSSNAFPGFSNQDTGPCKNLIRDTNVPQGTCNDTGFGHYLPQTSWNCRRHFTQPELELGTSLVTSTQNPCEHALQENVFGIGDKNCSFAAKNSSHQSEVCPGISLSNPGNTYKESMAKDGKAHIWSTLADTFKPDRCPEDPECTSLGKISFGRFKTYPQNNCANILSSIHDKSKSDVKCPGSTSHYFSEQQFSKLSPNANFTDDTCKSKIEFPAVRSYRDCDCQINNHLNENSLQTCDGRRVTDITSSFSNRDKTDVPLESYTLKSASNPTNPFIFDRSSVRQNLSNGFVSTLNKEPFTDVCSAAVPPTSIASGGSNSFIRGPVEGCGSNRFMPKPQEESLCERYEKVMSCMNHRLKSLECPGISGTSPEENHSLQDHPHEPCPSDSSTLNLNKSPKYEEKQSIARDSKDRRGILLRRLTDSLPGSRNFLRQRSSSRDVNSCPLAAARPEFDTTPFSVLPSLSQCSLQDRKALIAKNAQLTFHSRCSCSSSLAASKSAHRLDAVSGDSPTPQTLLNTYLRTRFRSHTMPPCPGTCSRGENPHEKDDGISRTTSTASDINLTRPSSQFRSSPLSSSELSKSHSRVPPLSPVSSHELHGKRIIGFDPSPYYARLDFSPPTKTYAFHNTLKLSTSPFMTSTGCKCSSPLSGSPCSSETSTNTSFSQTGYKRLSDYLQQSDYNYTSLKSCPCSKSEGSSEGRPICDCEESPCVCTPSKSRVSLRTSSHSLLSDSQSQESLGATSSMERQNKCPLGDVNPYIRCKKVFNKFPSDSIYFCLDDLYLKINNTRGSSKSSIALWECSQSSASTMSSCLESIISEKLSKHSNISCSDGRRRCVSFQESSLRPQSLCEKVSRKLKNPRKISWVSTPDLTRSPNELYNSIKGICRRDSNKNMRKRECFKSSSFPRRKSNIYPCQQQRSMLKYGRSCGSSATRGLYSPPVNTECKPPKSILRQPSNFKPNRISCESLRKNCSGSSLSSEFSESCPGRNGGSQSKYRLSRKCNFQIETLRRAVDQRQTSCEECSSPSRSHSESNSSSLARCISALRLPKCSPSPERASNGASRTSSCPCIDKRPKTSRPCATAPRNSSSNRSPCGRCSSGSSSALESCGGSSENDPCDLASRVSYGAVRYKAASSPCVSAKLGTYLRPFICPRLGRTDEEAASSVGCGQEQGSWPQGGWAGPMQNAPTGCGAAGGHDSSLPAFNMPSTATCPAQCPPCCFYETTCATKSQVAQLCAGGAPLPCPGSNPCPPRSPRGRVQSAGCFRARPCEEAASHQWSDPLGSQLLRAADAGRAATVRQLLAAGADPNYKDPSQWTALLRAARRGFAMVMYELLRAGADTRATTQRGFTPLHVAAFSERMGICAAFLIDAKAEVDARSESGRTPLHFAALAGHLRVVRVLLAAGADADARDQRGRTPADLTTDAAVRDALKQQPRARPCSCARARPGSCARARPGSCARARPCACPSARAQCA